MESQWTFTAMDFYRGSLWDVPGYENFTAGEDAADVTVYMAVREEPVPYPS